MTLRPMCRGMVPLLAWLPLGCSAAPPVPATPGPHAHWSYTGDEPLHWGDLDPAYIACKTGADQSPIELPLSPLRHEAAPPRPTWAKVPLRVTSNGHTVQVDDTAPSSLVVEGTTYKLVQFHFHSPSEHAIAGHHFAVEMHLVHKSDDGKLLAMAIFFESGAENATLAPVWSAIPASSEGIPVVIPGVTIDIEALLPSAPRYLRYKGSLTVPPCTEGVTWLVVVPDPNAQMSPAQIQLLRDRTQSSTSRPLQPVHGREVVELIP
jgi:carbonic anhydrase